MSDLDEILARADRIADFDHFPGVDELIGHFDRLVDDYPESITRTRIGTSRLGEPLWMYELGRGSRSALVYAGVHPNEPIGFCTVQQLATELCTDPAFADGLDCRWYLIPDIDPDGTRLNEGWFAGPFDRVSYARHFYRPQGAEQVEWSFPFAYQDAYFDRMIPETRALMRVIDRVRPTIAVSLHNGELGGVYYYLSRDVPGMVDALHRIAAHVELPLDQGEPESPIVAQYGTAVFSAISVQQSYEYRKSLGLPWTSDAGASSADYLARYGTVSLIAELPYWTHPKISDLGPTERGYADLLREVADELADDTGSLINIFNQAEPWLSEESQLVRASRSFLPGLVRSSELERARAGTEPANRWATVAEVFSLYDRNRCFRLRYGGMLLRAIEGEVARGAAPAQLHRLRTKITELYQGWQAEAATLEPELQLVPIRKLVGVQYAATLALLAAVR